MRNYGGASSRRGEDVEMQEVRSRSTQSMEQSECSRRGSIVRTSLHDKERAFHELVAQGNVIEVKRFLQDNKSFNMSCSNFQGMSALHIAVRKSNEQMVKFLLQQPGVEIGDAALHAIRGKQIEILTMILEKQKATYPGLEFAACADSAEFADNITPLILAAGSGHYEIVGLLLDRGHVIPRPHRPRCFCAEECLPMLRTQDALNAAAGKLHIYKALCNPVYICQSFADPILTAFKLSWELKEAGKVDMIFKKQYEELATQTRIFAANLISECRSSEEVETVLNEVRGSKMDRGLVMYPRLILALDYKQKEFVGQPNVQQVLEAAWIGDWYTWKGYKKVRKALYVLPRIFMLPFIVGVFVFAPGSSLASHYALPINKMLSSVASYAVFLALVFVQSDIDKSKQTRETEPTWIEYVLVIYVVAFISNSLRLVFVQGPRRFFHFAWNIYEIVMELMFVLTFIFWVAGFMSVNAVSEQNVERKFWHYLDPVLIAEGLFVVATIMAFMKILLICQINYDIGPFQVSLGKMTSDCAKFSIMLSVIILAFTAGLCKFYSYYTDMKQVDPDTGTESKQESSWVSVLDTLKTLFWGLFGMPSYSVSDVVIENLPDENDKLTIINEHSFTESIGYTAFAVYMVLTVIVILNMLIAAMSNTFQSVTDNIETEWVFGRTQVYLQFINQTALPAPFNLLPLKHGLMNCKKSPKEQPDEDVEKGLISEDKRDFHYLISQLVQRYFSNKSGKDKEG